MERRWIMNYLSLSLLQLFAQKLMPECHLEHGTELSAELVEFHSPTRWVRTYFNDGDKTLMSLSVNSHHLGAKGDPTFLWCCFQGSILYLKLFF